ncbi:hypothetical protein ACROYT_G005139, partial [Oculina patagonica]
MSDLENKKSDQAEELSLSVSVPAPLNNVMMSHTKKEVFKCIECDQDFSRASNLRVHKRTHTGEKPYQCSECGERFRISTHLTVHKRSHSGEKPYKCQFCDKCFSASSNCKR